MCGIFGYIGQQDPLKICLAGLEQLEYRGYDSTGIAGLIQGKIASYKKAGKLLSLKQELAARPPNKFELVIGHTRWATHGKVNDQNAHPHSDMRDHLALVHNGIIENYTELRNRLLEDGIVFTSETDSEVIVQLIAKYYAGDLIRALQQTIPLLKGIYALAVIHKDHPDEIVAAARECPLAVGIDKGESFISSDLNAIGRSGLDVLFLRDGEIASVKKGTVQVFKENKSIAKKTERFETESRTPSKEGFEHFMLKEIYEQPNTIAKAIAGREQEFEHLCGWLKNIKNVMILGCGTSAHAGSLGASYLEEIVRIPASCEIASEARYRESPLLTKETLVIAISQSGETADTIAALREAKKSGCKTLGLCNVAHSTLMRETDETLLLKAGPEVSVCATKSFTSQVALLFLFTLHLAKVEKSAPYFEELKKTTSLVQRVLDSAKELEKIAHKYASYDDFFFMGRREMYITCLEAALKLKEISYVHANGYPAGELKHGAIALINPQFPVVAFCSNGKTKDKILSNLMEVKARGAPLLAFAPADMEEVAKIADDVFWLPPAIDQLAPFPSIVAGQLLAYYIAKSRGCDIDQPRNLAKSVTVE